MNINLNYSVGNYNKTFQIKKEDIDKEQDKDKKALLQHLFDNQKYLNGKADNILSGNEIVNFAMFIDADGDGEVSEKEAKEWIEQNGAAKGNFKNSESLLNALKSILGDITEGAKKYATSLYAKYEKKSSEAAQNTTIDAYKKAGVKGSGDLKYNQTGGSELEKQGLFKFTPEGYMDIKDPNKKMETYTTSVLELANGELDKYDIVKREDLGKDVIRGLDIEEFMTQQKDIYKATYGKLDKMVGADSENFAPSFENYVKNLFATLDLNGDAILDEKELAAVYAYLDLGYAYTDSGEKMLDETGKQAIGVDGKISLGEGIPSDEKGNITNAGDVKDKLKEFVDFLFG